MSKAARVWNGSTLAETRAGDDAMKHVGAMKGLQWLSLWKTPVTGAGMGHFVDLPKLAYLRLAETAVGDQGLAEIAKVASLEELDLDLLRISDKGLCRSGVPERQFTCPGGRCGSSEFERW